MGAVKHSRQRDAIKTFLMSRKDHPTADVVYTFVKNDFPSISLGTVTASPCSTRKERFL